MAKKKKDLTPSGVYARLRPFDESGKSGHTADGDAGERSKTIESFDDTKVVINDQARREMTEFSLSKVIKPDADQEGAFNTAMVESGLLEGFHTDSNVLFFAYGQTGSGKTHTMLVSSSAFQRALLLCLLAHARGAERCKP